MQQQAREWLPQVRALWHALSGSRAKKAALTVSISAIGLTLAAHYFYRCLSERRKRILNKKRQIIQTIPELRSPNVHIKNPGHVETLLSNLLNGGKQRLQVVSDFDRTLSLCEYEGRTCPTSNSVFETSRLIPSETRDQFLALRDHYMPIEHDPRLSRAQKLPFMEEWWQKSFALVVESGVTREQLAEIVHTSAVHLRRGCEWFFVTTERHDIPLLIFSAGLGDIIREWILSACGGSFKNQKIVSNFMQFDPATGRVLSFNADTRRLIHIFNKNESALEDTEYGRYIENRHNLLLLGDSVGDVDMCTGLTNVHNVLKLGFLNQHADALLATYMDLYDIVVVNDPTFDVPNAILKSII